MSVESKVHMQIIAHENMEQKNWCTFTAAVYNNHSCEDTVLLPTQPVRENHVLSNSFMKSVTSKSILYSYTATPQNRSHKNINMI